jgi:hypothetical protein
MQHLPVHSNRDQHVGPQTVLGRTRIKNCISQKFRLYIIYHSYRTPHINLAPPTPHTILIKMSRSKSFFSAVAKVVVSILLVAAFVTTSTRISSYDVSCFVIDCIAPRYINIATMNKVMGGYIRINFLIRSLLSIDLSSNTNTNTRRALSRLFVATGESTKLEPLQLVCLLWGPMGAMVVR